jgi:hypothetical protein
MLLHIQNRQGHMCSECHGYGYTRGFHMGLAMGTGTGTRLPTCQKPVPIPVMVMQLCHTMMQPNMAVQVVHTLSPPPQVRAHCTSE